MVAIITTRDRPKTDYERWLELQGADNNAAGSDDEKQYHPPAPLPVPEHDQDAHEKADADDNQHKYTSHGTFIHHGYHHDRPGALADNNNLNINHHPHARLPHRFDGSFPGNYGAVAMKLALLVLVVLGILRAVRYVRGRRYQAIRLQSPRTVQGGFGREGRWGKEDSSLI
ncbi:hypothetical protein AbraIFM66950_000361 [Aspergillus brasiliensis]|nr:hypothetical protein AbraIFM66950_000361 [Aspergillus brasiliensis]